MDIPLILMSGYSDQVDASQIENYGFQDYLQKPFAIGTAVKIVRHLISK